MQTTNHSNISSTCDLLLVEITDIFIPHYSFCKSLKISYASLLQSDAVSSCNLMNLKKYYYYITHLQVFLELYVHRIGFLYNLCNLFYGFEDIILRRSSQVSQTDKGPMAQIPRLRTSLTIGRPASTKALRQECAWYVHMQRKDHIGIVRNLAFAKSKMEGLELKSDTIWHDFTGYSAARWRTDWRGKGWSRKTR